MKNADRNSETLDAVLRRAMDEPPGAATPECAYPESLAAYWDRSMDARARERFEAHLADCARCQTQLASIARADDSARVASADSKVAWYRRWGFAIPALAAAAAVVVFIAIKRPANEESQNAEVVAMAKREAPPASAPMPPAETAPAAPAAAPQVTTAAPPAPASNEIAMNTSRANRSPAEEPKSATRLHRMESSENPAARARAPIPPAGPSEAGRVVAIAPAAPFVAPSVAAQAPAQATPSVSSELAVNQYKMQIAQSAPSTGYAQGEANSAAVRGTGAMPPAQAGAAPASAGAMIGGPPGATIGGAGMGGGRGAIIGSAIGHPLAGAAVGSGAAVAATGQIIGAAPAADANYAEPLPMPAQVSTHDHSVTWIVGKGGMVQRRDANGAMLMQRSGVTTDLVAGAAPSASVCWIVGRSGTIIRTTDGGEHWTLIMPPATENLAMVSASSASDATIATAGGRKFATSNGGVSWRAE